MSDAAARFIELMHEHQSLVRRISSVYAFAPEDREDLHQEILLQSWRSFPSFSGRSKFSTWLCRVALNAAMLRKRKERRKASAPRPAGDLAEVAQPEPTEAAADLERLYQCIQQLSAVDRAIILLHLERRSYEEIAEILGLSRANISVRLVRLKERLRQLLMARECAEG